ncbi:MAG: FG-GAP-like repeat-containing protein, partial [Luteolibacter sp.]
YELFQYGTLDNDGASDTDGDGYTLLQEYTNGTEPHYVDPYFNDLTAMGASGSYDHADSSVIEANLAGYPYYTIRSVPAGTVDQRVAVPSGTLIATPNMLQADFGYWLLDGVRQEDFWGRALRYLEFTVDGADREAVAYLFPGDTDSDGIPDAYEQLHYGTLDNDAASDTDGDGYTLLQEYTNGTEPHYVDPSFSDLAGMGSSGSYHHVDSSLIEVNLAGYSAYTLRSVPEGVLDQRTVVPTGTLVATPNMLQADFGYWLLDGVRQEDFWGRALRYVEFVVDDVDREAVAHLFAGDTDADGIPDAFEQLHYGTLDNDAASDTDGDGYTLLQEYTNGTEPHYVDPAFSDLAGMGSSGSYNYVDSGIIIANLQVYERLEKIRTDSILTNFFSPDPDAPTGINVGAFASVAATDWDGDGDTDLFVSSNTGLRVWENIGTVGNPDFREITSGFSGLISYVSDVTRPRLAGGDWNNDGVGDLAIGGETTTVRLVASPGTWNSDGTGLDHATGSALSLPALGDMDGDGQTDLLVLLADGSVRMHPHDGTVTPYTGAGTDDYLGIAALNATSMATGYLDDDALLDVLVADSDGRIWEFYQQSDGSFFLLSKVWGGTYGGFAASPGIAALDLEGDGDVDLIAGLANGGVVSLRDPRVGKPTGLFATPGANATLLTWDANWQSRISGYLLYRSEVVDGTYLDLTDGSIIPLPQYNDITITRGNEYFYYATCVSRFFLPGNSEPRYIEGPPSDLAELKTGGPVIAGTVGVNLNDVRGRAGNTVKIKLSITNSDGVSGQGMDIHIGYDPAVLIPRAQGSGGATVVASGVSKD